MNIKDQGLQLRVASLEVCVDERGKIRDWVQDDASDFN